METGRVGGAGAGSTTEGGTRSTGGGQISIYTETTAKYTEIPLIR